MRDVDGAWWRFRHSDYFVPVVVVLALQLALGIAYLLYARGDDADGGAARVVTRDASTTTVAPTSTSAPEASTTTETTAASTTTTAAATTTTAASAAAPALPPADPAAPPQEPFGVYRDGKVTLLGSVPTPELAQGYLRKAASVLGEGNVTMQMTLDPRVVGATMRIDVDERFRFPEGSTVFDPEFEALLNLGAAALQLIPESTLVITGHTDSVGSEATNAALSHARAQVVVDFMVSRGIPPNRIIAVGAGESQPIASNDTPEGRAANRRIEAMLDGVKPA